MAALPESIGNPAKPEIRAVVALGVENVGQETQKALDGIFGEAGIAAANVDLAADLQARIGAVTTVDEAKVVIAEMAAVEIASKGRSKFPRMLLRIQHVAAFALMNPFCTNADICRFFQVSPSAIGNIMKTDTFKSLVDSHKISVQSLDLDIQQQMRDTLTVALDVVQKDIINKQDGEFALAAADKLSNRLGMGGRHQTAPTVQVNVITADMIAAARARRLPGAG